MSVIRVNKTKNYTVMSNYHFKEKKMSLKAKGTLSLLLSLPDDWQYSVSGLVTLSKDGKDSVMSALSELEKFGYLYREQLIDEKGRFAGIEYHIFEKPQAEYPISENPISDNQNAKKQNAENQRQLNTQLTKNSNNKIIYNINNYINLLDTVPDSQLRNLYVSFLENRNAMGDPMTVKGFEMLIERVRELAGLDIDRQRDLVRNAVINNWKNVYSKQEQPAANETINQLREFYE